LGDVPSTIFASECVQIDFLPLPKNVTEFYLIETNCDAEEQMMWRQ